jgi:hypothetical protein
MILSKYPRLKNWSYHSFSPGNRSKRWSRGPFYQRSTTRRRLGNVEALRQGYDVRVTSHVYSKMALIYVSEGSLKRRNRLFKERIGLDDFRDSEIVSRYRLDRSSIAELVSILDDSLIKSTKLSFSISSETLVNSFTLHYLLL